MPKIYSGSHDKVSRLVELGELVSSKPTPDEFLSGLIHGVFSPWGGRAAILGKLNFDSSLKMLACYGFSDFDQDCFLSKNVWEKTPLSDAIRESKHFLMRNKKEFADNYPDLVLKVESVFPTFESLVTCPLVGKNVSVGGLGIFFADMPYHVEDPLFWRGVSIISAPVIVGINGEEQIKNGLNQIKKEMLTERQIIILDLMAQGLTLDQVAHKLKFSDSTIHQESLRIYKYLGVHSRSEAVLVAKELGLLKSS